MADMDSKTRDQVVALAGIAQAAHLVDLVARTGSAPDDVVKQCVDSLFSFDPTRVEEIFGGLKGIKLGLQVLNDLLAGNNPNAHQFTLRYALGAIVLSRQLARQPDMLSIIRNRISHAGFHSEHFANSLDDVCRQVAALYQDTLSTFRFRIQVAGSAEHLRVTSNAERVRTLLFAAVRAASWWQAAGGSRWRLLLWRSRYLSVTRQLLRECDS